MPTGEGQVGKRRGKYRARSSTDPTGPEAHEASAGGWSEEDREHFDRLVADSPIASEAAKTNAARRATELSRQLRDLDSRARTVDEEKALIAASSQYRKWLEALKVTAKMKEDEEDL